MREFTSFPYNHILILGLAKSGSAAARLCLRHGRHVRINDQTASFHDPSVGELQALGAEVVLGSHPFSVLDGMDILVKNPGIPYDNPLVKEAQRIGLPIVTEIELAGQLAGESMIGITGSNGKTTVTTLIHDILQASNQKVKLAGNIGIVASDVAETLESDERMVVELSSFQLLGVVTFRPKIAVFLNLFEAHLDYHKTFDNYRQAKSNIFRHQTADDVLIYNADDPIVSESVQEAASEKIPFSRMRRLENGIWADGTDIHIQTEKLMPIRDVYLKGEHNLENVLAAIAASKQAGAENEAIRRVLENFTGVKHRLQYVGSIQGRSFYNDSKATNILATQKALEAFSQPVILLAGGKDRGNTLDALIPDLEGVRVLVIFGETARKLETVAAKAGVATIIRASDVDDAAHKAYAQSVPGDVILLSPACASWDQYSTFEERGDMFIEAVHKLE